MHGDRQSQPRLDGMSNNVAGGNAIQPTAIVAVDGENPVDATRDPLAPAPRAIVRDRQQIMAGGMPSGIDVPLGEGDELAGRELADATLMVMTAFDRNAGPIPLRAIVEQLVRRGRLQGDPQAAQTQLSASLRADNLRRGANGQRPRFRFAGGQRVAPTDWSLGPDLARLEQEVGAAVERYREAARRTMLRRLQELPGHAFLELALLGLERIGMSNMKSVRRAGSPGGEAHFSAVHRTGSDEIRTAIVIRKDGREIGRERVSDLRGALHHYGPANAGWLVTTGQVLSGAREEAAAVGAAPIALYDGLAFCKLLEESDVGVVRTKFQIAIPDLELLESIRG
jgi:restriction endonuclease Mrr